MAMRVVRRRSRLAAVLVAAGVAAVLGASAAVSTGVALAHGSMVDAPARNFSCWQRWHDKFQAPEMKTQDPMCFQAWQKNANTMWNWNGLYRNGLGGAFQAKIPDGTLCSGGHAEGDLYASLDTVGDWVPKSVPRSFTMTLFDGAKHGADFVRIYLTKAGFDPTKQALGWNDLEKVAEVGNTPTAKWQAASTPGAGVQLKIDVSATRSGRAIVYSIWQASHLDQAYFLCSDVNIA